MTANERMRQGVHSWHSFQPPRTPAADSRQQSKELQGKARNEFENKENKPPDLSVWSVVIVVDMDR